MKAILRRKPWTYKDPVREGALRQRNRDIFESLSKGITLKEIGARYGITRQRVQQIAEQLDAPSTIEVRKRLKEQRLKKERERLRQRPCFICDKPARSTRVAHRRMERVYCDKCRALISKDTNIKAAMQVPAASIILAAKKFGVCTLCRHKLLGSNAYRGILCTKHDKFLRAAVHNARQAMRNHPDLDWKRILREAAVCRTCGRRQAAPGLMTCRRCANRA
jgi:hypothetical protein